MATVKLISTEVGVGGAPIVIGCGSQAASDSSGIAIGTSVTCHGGVVVGRDAVGTARSVVIGLSARVAPPSGSTAVTDTTDVVLVGNGSSASGAGSVVVGGAAIAAQPGAIVVGACAQAGGSHAVAVGSSATADASDAVVVGYRAAGSTGSVAIGANSSAGCSDATALGSSASAASARSIAIGNVASASGGDAIAMGSSVSASNARSIAIGDIASASGGDAIAIGTEASANSGGAVAIGPGAHTGSLGCAVAIGSNCTARGDSVSVGRMAGKRYVSDPGGPDNLLGAGIDIGGPGSYGVFVGNSGEHSFNDVDGAPIGSSSDVVVFRIGNADYGITAEKFVLLLKYANTLTPSA